MGPVGRVSSNFGDRGDQVYNRVFGPLQILQLAVIFFAGILERPRSI